MIHFFVGLYICLFIVYIENDLFFSFSCQVDRSFVSAVLTDKSSAEVNMEEVAENITIFSLDPSLEAYKDHFKYRIKTFTDQKRLIEKHEGSLEEFAQGNTMKFGT